ncbi:MAG: 50S ribosomal protein L6 [Victivallales bacterium]|nr:50S ribosomal protein L6 [Victivallales bacterium]MBR6374587.1 50S ribosomal protein L6 [Victivallales bacterium]
MSRMGNKPIDIPAAAKLEQNGQDIKVSGPLGQLSWTLPQGITLEIEGAKLHVKRANDTKNMKMMHGTSRSLINSMIIGVTAGFKIDLELSGVGYRASVAGQKMTLNLGYSNPIEYTVPDGVTVKMPDQTHISLTSVDKQLVGQVAATIRRFRVPDSYHGKGVVYAGEHLTLKEGKRA